MHTSHAVTASDTAPCWLTCGRDEAEPPHVILQVAPEQDNLLCVEAYAARVGCKDCCGQQLA